MVSEPREMNVYERYDDPNSDASLFDFRPRERDAALPDPEVTGLEDTGPEDVNPGPTPDELKAIEAEGSDLPKDESVTQPSSSDPNPGLSEPPA